MIKEKNSQKQLAEANRLLQGKTAEQRVAWALEHLPGAHILSSSFGVQAAVSLHLLTRQISSIPVVLIDTGYLFAETYQFVDQLSERLQLNLKIYRSALSPAWQEARYGKLWEEGVAGIEQYNRLNKVEPMAKALDDLEVGTWFSGLRRVQAQTRAEIPFISYDNGRYKVHPIADWTDKDVHVYLKKHNLPYHPLRDQGYVSLGDTHTTKPWYAGISEEETRFFGLKRECGLHTDL